MHLTVRFAARGSSPVKHQAVLFDWGDTTMRVFPDERGPMASWSRVQAMPGIADALDALRPSARIALATNAADSTETQIRDALGRVGLERSFDRVYCYRAVGHRKPSEGFFNAVLADLAVDRSCAFMVGDDFMADVDGANGVGLAAIWYAPAELGAPSGPTYRTIHHFSQLPRALMELGFRDGCV